MNAEQKARKGDIWLIAEVMPDWTTVQFNDGRAIAFNRETGRIYQIPHPDCPFVIIPSPENTRPAPTEAEVEAAAKRIYSCEVWAKSKPWGHEDALPLHDHYRRMARAALGLTK